MKTLTTSLVVLAVGVLAGHSLHAAVKDAAFLQGSTLADGSTVLDSATPKAIRWTERSSIDPNTFAHSFTDPAKLIVKKDGDYLVAATMPLISINTADNRPSQALEVYVNGEPAPGTVGSSGYIRNQPRNINMQQETSDHAHALLAGLSAGDMIEVRAHKTAQAALATGIQSASLYVELVDNSRTVFAALSDGPISGANLNPNFNEDGDDPAELGWTSTRKDAGITHSDGSADIRLSAGTYVLFVNIPMQATVQRASAGLEVLLDDEVVPGGLARQGYIRNASGHTRASVHWAGVIEVSGTKTLTLQTYRLARAGQVSLQSDKQASVYLEKIDAGSGLIASSAITVDNANNPDNWNPDAKAALVWEEPAAIDSALYRHNNSSIQVRRAGSYLLLYHDNLYSAAARPNPRISVEVNGAEVPGAETKSHYIRSEDGHNESSSTLVFLLEDLAANDTITISTQKEGQNGDVFSVDDIDPIDGGAIFSLIQKESIDPSNIESAPRLLSANGNINGFEASIQNFATTVDESSVQATLNGESVEADVSKDGDTITVSYTPSPLLASGAEHTVELVLPESTRSWSFTVVEYATLTPDLKVNPDISKRGFLWRAHQNEAVQVDSVAVATAR